MPGTRSIRRMRNFYPRPPRGGRPSHGRFSPFCHAISIHALREEGDSASPLLQKDEKDFYPRPPRGGRRSQRAAHLRLLEISIHALREEGDQRFPSAALRPLKISIHALREEGDLKIVSDMVTELISIHALREEGDRLSRSLFSFTLDFYPRPPLGGRPGLFCFKGVNILFLSTPSARRATSSHSPRNTEPSDFYPRPPRGGRPKPVDYKKEDIPISIHALREEGDVVTLAKGLGGGFLSTPSARRATAKTETKSLFSNKLYNILHEFRRALIYNGSKSYPNHAK